MPPVTTEHRHSMANLAFGKNALPISFYDSLECNPSSKNNEDMFDSNKQQNNEIVMNEFGNFEMINSKGNQININKNNTMNTDYFDLETDNFNLKITKKEFNEVIARMKDYHNKFGTSKDSLQKY